jgi:spore germination cell wall hydrolase CwlJ-like protein
MTDQELIALCAFEEANLECDDGLAAVVRVIKNRMARKYQSDGTAQGTIYAGNGTAFSWAAFAMFNLHYQRVASGLPAIKARAVHLGQVATHYTAAWMRAEKIAGEVMAGTYSGALYQLLTDDTVLYLNPAIAQAPWASRDKVVCSIGHHTFYRA